MADLFTWSAWIGGTILVGQTLLTLLGFGLGDLDAEAGFDAEVGLDVDAVDAAHEGFLSALSLRALVAFATFFGLTGLAAHAAEASPGTTLVLALGAGVLSIFLVAQAMRALARLQSSGTLDIRRAIGSRARVYLRIPARGEGHGRVHVDVQGRRVEARAISRAAEIATGAEVRVIDIAPDGAVVVEPYA